jgi:hypothetical protein
MSLHEEWRDVSSMPGVQASSLGRIRLKPYEAPMPRGGVRTYGGGSPVSGVWCNRHKRMVWRYRGKNLKIARLVCEAFHGAPPFDKAVCMHIDENSRNNRPENLSWGTQRENLNAPGFLAYCRSRLGEKSPMTKHRSRFLN